MTSHETGVDAPVSFTLGLYRCVGNTALYRRLMDRFLATRLSAPDDIRALWLDGNVTDSAMMAHSMISTAGSLGATSLSESARALQDALKEQDPAQVERSLQAFRHEHARAVDAFRAHIAG